VSSAVSPAARRHEHSVSLTRVFDAPREQVFAAWTRAEHLAHWFGPKGFTIHSCEADPRPGGVFRLCMRSPGGKDYWVRGEYREVVAPERLVITCTAEDENGIARLEEIIRMSCTESGGRTKLTVNATSAGQSDVAVSMLKGMDRGWAETIDRLADRVAEKR
jgi:uncharacterized protein YndB with AHSA1/START domain